MRLCDVISTQGDGDSADGEPRVEMTATIHPPSPTQSELSQSELSGDALPANLFATLPPDLKNDRYPNARSSVGKRASIPLVGFLIIFCIGVALTVAWRPHGAREMRASSYPQVSGSEPQAEPVVQGAPDVIVRASPTASSPDYRQPNGMLLDFDAVRQSIDRIATSIASNQGRMMSTADQIATNQEQMARSVDQIARSIEGMATAQKQIGRNVDRIATTQEQITLRLDQLTADQERMTREIAKLQEIEQSVRSKNSESSPRPSSAPSPKPLLRPASASAPKPASTTPTLPEPVGPSWPQGTEESAKQRP
jgi:hypothetical protein